MEKQQWEDFYGLADYATYCFYSLCIDWNSVSAKENIIYFVEPMVVTFKVINKIQPWNAL